MTRNTQLKWIRPALQARSQQTLERLLDGAELVMSESGLEGLTVAAVAKRAESSVGSFYARFKDKDGLLHCIFERFNDQAIATSKDALRPERWAGVALEQVLVLMVRFIIEVFEERRGVVVAMVARSTVDDNVVKLRQRLSEALVSGLLELLEHRKAELHHPDPATATQMLVWLVMSGLQTRVVEAPAKKAISDEQVATEIGRICASYLGLEAVPATDATARGDNNSASVLRAV